MKNNMINLGKYPVFLKGDGRTIWRVIYKDKDGRMFIKYYGDFIEVVRGMSGYFVTVSIY